MVVTIRLDLKPHELKWIKEGLEYLLAEKKEIKEQAENKPPMIDTRDLDVAQEYYALVRLISALDENYA